MSKYKKKKRVRVFIKLLLCTIYLIIIGILVFASFRLFQEEEKIVAWKEVEKTSQYTYLEILEMSEAFAEIPEEEKQIHFVIEKEGTGEWHTYLIAIKKSDYEKYKDIIDYTYERSNTEPTKVKVYGYPISISDEIKELAIKNITNFVPIENEVVITNENFEQYLTNTYLDTTLQKTHEFNYFVFILLLVALSLFILLIFTIFDKDKLVDEVDSILEKDLKKQRKRKNTHKSTKSKNTKNSSIKKESTSPKKEKTTKENLEKKEKAPEKKVEKKKVVTKEQRKDSKKKKPVEKKEKKKEEEIELI